MEHVVGDLYKDNGKMSDKSVINRPKLNEEQEKILRKQTKSQKTLQNIQTLKNISPIQDKKKKPQKLRIKNKSYNNE